jgi:hypothetical protein
LFKRGSSDLIGGEVLVSSLGKTPFLKTCGWTKNPGSRASSWRYLKGEWVVDYERGAILAQSPTQGLQKPI